MAEQESTELKPKGFGVSAHIAVWEARSTGNRQQNIPKKAPKEIKRARARANTDPQLNEKGRYQQPQKWNSSQQKAKRPVPSPRLPKGRAAASTQDHMMIHQQHIGQSHRQDSPRQQGSNSVNEHQNANYVHSFNQSKDGGYVHFTEANPRPANWQPAVQKQQHRYSDPYSDYSYIPQQLPPSHVQNPNPYNLEVGSTVQISATNPNDPPCYGVIRWIGTVSGVQGLVAGIELVSTK